MKISIHYLLVAGCFAQQAYCAHMQQVPRSYQGVVITEANITALAPQAPAAVKEATEKWLAANPQVAATALGYESFIPLTEITLEDGTKRKTIKPLLDATNAMLEAQGTKNMSQWNYVFQHPAAQDWLVKIAGHVNRKYNLSHMIQALEMNGSPWDENNQGKAGYDYNRALTQSDYDRFANELHIDSFDRVIKGDGQAPAVMTAPKTYQHISRVAHYLLLRDAIEQKKISQITAPEMYLVQIPHRPAAVSDRNYIVIEKKLEGLRDIDKLTPEQEKELETAIRLTGLFNINRENCKLTQDGKIAILDFEQPNNSLPQHFFHKSPARFANNMQAGINSFNKMKEELAKMQKATTEESEKKQ